MNTQDACGSPDLRERRRAVRRRVENQRAALPIVASVQVMDISRGGVLVAADCAFNPDDKGTLCVDINGSSFKAVIQVQRIAPARTAGHRHELGASFLTAGPEYDLLLTHI